MEAATRRPAAARLQIGSRSEINLALDDFSPGNPPRSQHPSWSPRPSEVGGGGRPCLPPGTKREGGRKRPRGGREGGLPVWRQGARQQCAHHVLRVLQGQRAQHPHGRPPRPPLGQAGHLRQQPTHQGVHLAWEGAEGRGQRPGQLDPSTLPAGPAFHRVPQAFLKWAWHQAALPPPRWRAPVWGRKGLTWSSRRCPRASRAEDRVSAVAWVPAKPASSKQAAVYSARSARAPSSQDPFGEGDAEDRLGVQETSELSCCPRLPLFWRPAKSRRSAAPTSSPRELAGHP